MTDTSVDSTDESRNNTRRRAATNQDNIMNIDDMMKDLYEQTEGENAYKFRRVIQRTLVLLGRTRVGKTTLMRVIQNPFHRPDMPSLISDTGRVHIHQFVSCYEKQHYSFTVIDSPGLFECMRHDGKPLTNETVRRLVDNCITKDVTHIHAFAFVFSSAGGINAEDIQSMIFIKNNYPRLKKHFMLILTHCEEKTEAEREQFINEFFQHPEVRQHNLREFFGLGVFYTGSLRPELQSNPNLPAAASQGRKVLAMRSQLLNFLIRLEDTFNIHYLDTTRPKIWKRINQTLSWICGFAIVLLILGLFILANST